MNGEGISVLLVDDNQEFTDMLGKRLKSYTDIRLAGTAGTGTEALEMIKLLQPDIVLLDIILPGIDGICVLERVASGSICPKASFIVITTAGQDSVVRRAIRLGAEYYMLKPFMIDVLVKRIRQVYYGTDCCAKGQLGNSKKWYWQSRNLIVSDSNTGILIAEFIRKMGLMPNITGYYYLLEAIEMLIDKPDIKGCVTKLLYPAIAAKFGTTPRKVERSIRNAINISWKKENSELREMYREKPTNSEFVCTIAEWMRIANKYTKNNCTDYAAK